jgi:branched-chain amino acid transport system substrate-binding protein
MVRRVTVYSLKIVGLLGLVLSLLIVAHGRPLFAAESIKIGAVLSITGRGGFLGTPEKEAITVVAEEINRQGGINGQQLELFFEDDQSNPTNAAIAATKLIRDKKVSCIIGASLVVSSMAMIPVCEREQVPMIVPAPLTIPFTKWVFLVPVNDYVLAQRMLKFTVETLGAKKIALLHSVDTYGKNGAQGVTDGIAKLGATLLITEKFEPADTSMIPQLTKVKAAKPEAIILYANANPAAVIAKNYGQLGMDAYVVGSGGIPTPEFLKLTGKVVEGGRWIVFGPKDLYTEQLPPDDPYRKNLLDPLRKAIQEKYGKTEWNGFYKNGHDPIRILIEGLKVAGTGDRAALRNALEKVKYQGMLGNFKYSPTDHEGTAGEAYEPVTIKDGKYWPFKK